MHISIKQENSLKDKNIESQNAEKEKLKMTICLFKIFTQNRAIMNYKYLLPKLLTITVPHDKFVSTNPRQYILE